MKLSRIAGGVTRVQFRCQRRICRSKQRYMKMSETSVVGVLLEQDEQIFIVKDVRNCLIVAASKIFKDKKCDKLFCLK